MANSTYGGMEHIDGLHSRLALLFESEHQIDPVVEVPGHMIGLERLS